MPNALRHRFTKEANPTLDLICLVAPFLPQNLHMRIYISVNCIDMNVADVCIGDKDIFIHFLGKFFH